MPTFRLDGRPFHVPGSWAELQPAQFFAAAPYLVPDTVMARYRALQLWCPGLQASDLKHLTDEQLWDILSLLSWAWNKELDTVGVERFTHRGQQYNLPKARLAGSTLIEYGLGEVFFAQLAAPGYPQQRAVAQLMASLCRVQGAIRPAAVDFPGLIQTQAGPLLDAPLGIKLVVVYRFLSAARLIHRTYQGVIPYLEEPGELVKGGEMLGAMASLAIDGDFGGYEQLAETGLHTVLFKLADKARNRRVAEKS